MPGPRFARAAVLLASAIALAAASPAHAAVDPTCAFSDRFPVDIGIAGAEGAAAVVHTGIDVDRVDLPDGPYLAGVVRAYVNDAERAELEAAGYAVRAVPNEAKEMWEQVRREWESRGGEELSPQAWPTFAEYEADLQAVAAAHPEIVRVQSLGTSVQGRNLWIVHITDNPDVEENEPEFKFTSSIHGDEVTGMDLCRRMIHYLVDNYDRDATVQTLVDGVDLWFCPLHNPDGYVNGTRYNAHGKDLNRNFPDPVTDPNDNPTGREPEVQHMMNFGYAHNFILSANYHGGALVMNIPWDCQLAETPDHEMIWTFAEGYSIHNPPMWNSPYFYHGVTLGAEWYIIHGGLQDWCYNWRNEIDITIEVSETKWPSWSQMDTYWSQNRDGMLDYMQRTLTGVRGTITDGVTGAPIAAKVEVLEIGKEIRADQDLGDYHRMLLPGTYTMRFSALGYTTVTIPNVTVVGQTATTLDVTLLPPGVDVAGGETVEGLDLHILSPNPALAEDLPIQLALGGTQRGDVDLTVLDCAGRLVRRLDAAPRVAWDGFAKDGSRAPAGIYWVVARGASATATERVVVLR